MKIANCLFVVFFLVFLSSCSKNDDSGSADIETTPSAVVANNSSSAGIYKGVMVGSSGYFKISIKNGDETIYCDFVFDGAKARLTTASLASWASGTAINNAVFTGTCGGKIVSLTFSCAANGANPIITVAIPGHSVNVAVFKETSVLLVKVYEGTYNTVTPGAATINGVWNISISGSSVLGQRSETGITEAVTGTVSGNTLIVNGKTLNIDDSSVSGSWTENTETVTVTGHRVM